MSTRAPSILTRLDIKFFDQASCAESDSNLFFPNENFKESIENTKAAKAICFSCLNRQDCLDYALLIDDRWATLGGLDAKERGKLRKIHKKMVKECLKADFTFEEIAKMSGLDLEYVTTLYNERFFVNGHTAKEEVA